MGRVFIDVCRNVLCTVVYSGGVGWSFPGVFSSVDPLRGFGMAPLFVRSDAAFLPQLLCGFPYSVLKTCTERSERYLVPAIFLPLVDLLKRDFFDRWKIREKKSYFFGAKKAK